MWMEIVILSVIMNTDQLEIVISTVPIDNNLSYLENSVRILISAAVVDTGKYHSSCVDKLTHLYMFTDINIEFSTFLFLFLQIY